MSSSSTSSDNECENLEKCATYSHTVLGYNFEPLALAPQLPVQQCDTESDSSESGEEETADETDGAANGDSTPWYV